MVLCSRFVQLGAQSTDRFGSMVVTGKMDSIRGDPCRWGLDLRGMETGTWMMRLTTDVKPIIVLGSLDRRRRSKGHVSAGVVQHQIHGTGESPSIDTRGNKTRLENVESARCTVGEKRHLILCLLNVLWHHVPTPTTSALGT